MSDPKLVVKIPNRAAEEKKRHERIQRMLHQAEVEEQIAEDKRKRILGQMTETEKAIFRLQEDTAFNTEACRVSLNSLKENLQQIVNVAGFDAFLEQLNDMLNAKVEAFEQVKMAAVEAMKTKEDPELRELEKKLVRQISQYLADKGIGGE